MTETSQKTYCIAENVCRYFIQKANEKGIIIDDFKMHVLMYYSQAYHLVHFNFPLFEEFFKAAYYDGPIFEYFTSEAETVNKKDSTSLYTKYNTTTLQAEKINFDPDLLSLLNAIFDNYAVLSSEELHERIVKDLPLREAYEKLRTSNPNYLKGKAMYRISIDTMKSFYTQDLEDYKLLLALGKRGDILFNE
jgi:uncharacterized phage-associated protein